MTIASKDLRASGRPPSQFQRWWRVIRRLIGYAFVGVGGVHIAEGMQAIHGGMSHFALGALLIAAGAIALFRDTQRTRQRLGRPNATTLSPAEDLDRPLQLAFNHGRSTGAVAAAALMVAASLFVLIAPWIVLHPRHLFSPEMRLVFSTVSAFGLLFFGGCLLWLLHRRLDLTPALTADALGVVDRSNALGSHTRVPWRDIEGFRAKAFMGQAFVVVDLADPQRFTRQAHGLRWFAITANQRLVGSPWCITPSLLGCTAEELAARLDARRKHYLQLD